MLANGKNRGEAKNRIASNFIRKIELALAERPDLWSHPVKTEWGILRCTNGLRPILLLDDAVGIREVSRLPGLLKIGIAKSLAEKFGLTNDLASILKLSESNLINEKLKDESKVIPFPQNRYKRF